MAPASFSRLDGKSYAFVGLDHARERAPRFSFGGKIMLGGGVGRQIYLSDLVPDSMFVGTSLILRQGGKFLYGIRPPRVEGSRQVIELTGIGGALEDEDDSLAAGVLREAREEMGCDVRLLPCRETLVVRGRGDLVRVALQGEEQPAALVFRRYGTPPHQPWHEDDDGEACLVIFDGELAGEPWPAMELPALVWLKPTHIIHAAQHDVPLRGLLDSGAMLVGKESGLVPATAWVRLTDSQEALVLALGDDALAFYEAMLERQGGCGLSRS